MISLLRSAFSGLQVSLAAASLALASPGMATQQPVAMPEEYSQIVSVVNRLAANNDLGDRELAFTVVTGDYAAWMAEELGLCKENGCSYYSSLNPYAKHRLQVDEIIRQAYLYGDINAQAYTNGTIEIPRVAFRVYGSRTGYMACTIAHEIAHTRDSHTYFHSEELGSRSKGMNDESKKLLDYEINRDFEILADQKAWEMTFRAGYPADMCVRELMFSHRSSGQGAQTEPDSTHPGVRERIALLNQYIAAKQGSIETQSPTRGQWLYQADLNVLRFLPQQRTGEY
ncbi:MAG: hypothetical protein RLZZ516_2710 [Cyanobacteriota bacterium]|jgi:hypothetical protein